MNRVGFVRVMTPAEARELYGEEAGDREPNVQSPVDLFDSETGEPIGYVRRADAQLMTPLRQAMKRYPMSTTLRSGGMRNRSCVFGFAARNQVLRREGCRSCGGATTEPEAHTTLTGAAMILSGMLAAADPERVQEDYRRAFAVRPEWRMASSQWTSGVVNETSALLYHTDANNMPTWNAMIVARRGTRGGFFHVPEYDLTLPCRDGDVCFFPAYRLVHGVTPITKRDEDGYRYSAVYYTVSRMKECLSPEEELAHGRAARSEREDTLLDRQRESGLLTAE